MKNGPWAACVTLGGQEYAARVDCERFGLHPYLPQQRKLVLPRGAVKPMLRASPLFPRYLFLPIHEARMRQLHHVRGLAGHSYLLASAEGTLWTAPAEVIFELARAENMGEFDELEPGLGTRVRLRGNGALSGLQLFVASIDVKTAQLFSPLFNGCRITAKLSDLARAAA
jgi:hypothetical protein